MISNGMPCAIAGCEVNVNLRRANQSLEPGSFVQLPHVAVVANAPDVAVACRTRKASTSGDNLNGT